MADAGGGGMDATLSGMPTREELYAQRNALPENVVGEILDGVLYTFPRPATPHGRAASVLQMDLGGPFDRGRGGPGGWLILHEPELHLGEDVLQPDIVGWRRERMPVMLDVVGVQLAPDWICEVLSPSTRKIDRLKKMPIFARERVPSVWLVEPLEQMVEVFLLDGETYRLLGAWGDDAKVRLPPFAEVELDLAALWSR